MNESAYTLCANQGRFGPTSPGVFTNSFALVCMHDLYRNEYERGFFNIDEGLNKEGEFVVKDESRI